MARVRVKLKATGQIGTVEDTELKSSPDKFELATSPSQGMGVTDPSIFHWP